MARRNRGNKKAGARLIDRTGNEFPINSSTPMFRGRYKFVINYPTRDNGIQTKEIELNLNKGPSGPGPTPTPGPTPGGPGRFKLTVTTNISGNNYYQGDLVELRWRVRTTTTTNPRRFLFLGASS